MRSMIILLFLTSVLTAQTNSSTTTIVPADRQLEKVAVLNLKQTEGVTPGEAELLSDRLRNELFSTGVVQVMERDQMQAVLAEQGFQQSGTTCTDEGCMVEAGKLLGVKLLVAGSIGKLGKLFMVNVKSINVETGQIMKVVSEDVRGDIEDVVAVFPEIALKLTCCAPGVNREIKLPLKETLAAKIETLSKPEPKPQIDNEPLPCDGTVYIEQVGLPKSLIGFTLTPDDAKEIDETVADAFNEAFDKEMYTASAERLATATCSALTLRILPKSYTVKPAARGQFTGTLTVEIDLYASPKASTPLHRIVFTQTGDRHWGDIQPLKNAVESLGEAIEDEYFSKVKKLVKM